MINSTLFNSLTANLGNLATAQLTMAKLSELANRDWSPGAANMTPEQQAKVSHAARDVADAHAALQAVYDEFVTQNA